MAAGVPVRSGIWSVVLKSENEASLKLEAIPSLRSMVAARLREAIVTARFPPGARLIERNLCELLGVSRTSVREALRELESEGLVTQIPNRGPVVTTLNAKEARDIFAIRAELEGLASSLFATEATDAQVAALDATADRLAEVYDNFDPAKFLRVKDEFYTALLEGANNDSLAALVRTILARVARLRVVSLSRPARTRESIKEIRKLVEALKTRDPAAARRACQKHIENAAAAALTMLDGSESAD